MLRNSIEFKKFNYSIRFYDYYNKENDSEDISPRIEDIEEDNKDDLKTKVRCFWDHAK